MPNTYVTLDVPRTAGVGAPTFEGNTSATKTFVFDGLVGLGARYTIEGSHDGSTWDLLVDPSGEPALFTGSEGERTVDALVNQVRVKVTGAIPVLAAPSISMGAGPALAPNAFFNLNGPLPVDLGVSAGPIKTVIARGDGLGRGGRVRVFASLDGIHYDEAFFFDRDQAGSKTERIIARYFRAQSEGSTSTPTVTMGAEGLFEGSGFEELALTGGGRLTTTTTEEVLAPFSVPLGSARASRFYVALTARVRLRDAIDSQDAPARLRVRLGGGLHEPDGEELLEVLVPATCGESVLDGTSLPFARPTSAEAIVKITGECPAGALALTHFGLAIRGA